MGSFVVQILLFLLIFGLMPSNIVDGSQAMPMKNKNGKKLKYSLLQTQTCLTLKNFKHAFFFSWKLRGTWGEGVLNTATPQKKINKHRITARKVNETPSPQHPFLAP